MSKKSDPRGVIKVYMDRREIAAVKRQAKAEYLSVSTYLARCWREAQAQRKGAR